MAVLFPFPPNYDTSPTESLEMLSDVLRCYDGSEQRRAIRERHRRAFQYKYTLLNTKDFERNQNLLMGKQNQEMALPVWMDIRRTATANIIGDTTVDIDPTNYSFVEGGSLVFFASPTLYEIAEILTVGSDVELTLPLTKNWPVGSAVYPLLYGSTLISLPVQRHTDNKLEGTFTFKGDPVKTDPFTPAGTAPTIYDSKEVVTTQPNWISAIDGSFDFNFDTLDPGPGAVENMLHDIYSRNIRRYSWTLKNRAEIAEFRKFLARCRGMVKTFWAPTWTQDFTIVSNVASGNAYIIIAQNGYLEYAVHNSARDRVVIRTHTGQTYYRRITSVVADGANIRLNLNASLGTAYTVAQLKPVSALNLCRFATDKVDLIWNTDSVVTVTTTLTTVPA